VSIAWSRARTSHRPVRHVVCTILKYSEMTRIGDCRNMSACAHCRRISWAVVGLVLGLSIAASDATDSRVHDRPIADGKRWVDEPIVTRDGLVWTFRAGPDGSSRAANVAGSSCPSLIEILLPEQYMAHRYDSVRGVTEIYCPDYNIDSMIRFDVDSQLNVTMTPLGVPPGIPWIVGSGSV
jgi:hypothetical protein